MKPYLITSFVMIIIDVINLRLLYHDWKIASVTNTVMFGLKKAFFASGTKKVFLEIEMGSIGAIWFLPALFFAQIIFQYILNNFSKSITTQCLICSLLCLLGVVSAKYIWLPFSIQSSFVALLFIWIGYLVKQLNILNYLKGYHYTLAATIFLICVYYGKYEIYFVVASFKNIFIGMMAGLTGCLLIYGISLAMKNNLIFKWIGNNSLVILCSHIISLNCIRKYYYKPVINILGEGTLGYICILIIEIFIALIGALFVDLIKKTNLQNKNINGNSANTYNYLNVLRGISLFLFLLSRAKINETLGVGLNSICSICFLFILGYLHSDNRSSKESFINKSMIYILPYLAAITVNWMMFDKSTNVTESFVKYIAGMSFSKSILSQIENIGYISLILILWAVEIIYIIIERYFKNDFSKHITVCVLVVIGMVLGERGYWLPWSFDVALVMLAVYHIGHYFKEKDFLSFMTNNYVLYFWLSLMIAFLVHQGGIDIFIRNYGKDYIISILGSLSGIMLLYMLAKYISDHLPSISSFIELFGKSYLYIFLIHCFVGDKMGNLFDGIFSKDGFVLSIISIFIQLVLGTILFLVFNHHSFSTVRVNLKK